MTQHDLFGQPVATARKGRARRPDRKRYEALGEVALWAARCIVRDKLLGAPPPGWDREDMIQHIALRVLERIERWRDVGKKPLDRYAYNCARFIICDFFRRPRAERPEGQKRRKTKHPEDVDVMDRPDLVYLADLVER
ncbi:MAG: sigma-70 family RNA polymerase sigma factor [Planctomycetes bacterium]|nr:sigma-70 family RNA polymerase sigma factor [Planctomycetota bacterium]